MHLWDLLLYVHFLTDSLGFGLWTLLQEIIVFIGHAGFTQCKQCLHSTLFLSVETSTSCCKVVTGASSFKVSSFCSFPHNFKGFICTSAPFVTSQRDHFHYLFCHCHLYTGELHRATGTSQLWLAVSNCTIICTYSASSHCLLLSKSERD